jgi:murein hydrolase activator
MADLEREITDLREQYQMRARNAYVYGRINDLALILAAESINQMLVRARYLQRFTSRRRTKLDEIRGTVDDPSSRVGRSSDHALAERGAAARDGAGTAQSRTPAAEPATGRQRTAHHSVQVIEADIARKRASARELEERIRRLIEADERGQPGRRRDRSMPLHTRHLTGSFTTIAVACPGPRAASFARHSATS